MLNPGDKITHITKDTWKFKHRNFIRVQKDNIIYKCKPISITPELKGIFVYHGEYEITCIIIKAMAKFEIIKQNC